MLRSRRVVLPDGERPAAVECATGGSPRSRPCGRTTSPASDLGDAGAAARAGRHPRARQRARPHRVGGLRHRDPGRRGRRRDHDHRHAAELAPAHGRRSTRWRSSGPPRRGQCHGRRRLLGRRGARQRGRPARAARRRRVRVQGASSPTPACPSSRRWTRPGWRAALAAVDALFVVHAEDPAELHAAGAVARLRATSSPPGRRRAEARRGRHGDRRRPGRRRAGAHPAPVGRRRAAGWSRRRGRTGVRVTAETCPHYLTLDGRRGARRRDRVQVLPADPRRGQPRPAVGRRWPTARSTAWSPTTRRARPTLKQPDTGDFAAAWGGIASLQLGLPVVWTEAPARGHALADVVRWMATGPADLVGLTHKGRIAVGRRRRPGGVRPGRPRSWSIRRALHHRHPVTPYAGRTLRGVVRATWLRGEPVDRTTRRAARAHREGDGDDRMSRRCPTWRRGDSAAGWWPPTTSSSPPPTTWSTAEPPVFSPQHLRAQGPGVRRLGDPPPPRRPATTGRSSGSARPASCAASSWTPRSSPATTRPYASVEGCGVAGYPAPEALSAADWVPLVPRSPLAGDSREPVRGRLPAAAGHPRAAQHLPGRRGGPAARARRGRARPDGCCPDGWLDLAALENGGQVVGCSDMFYGSPHQPARCPGWPARWATGWETRAPPRRRQRLGARAAGGARRRCGWPSWTPRHFKGNAPGAASLRGVDSRVSDVDDPAAWFTLLPRTDLRPDTRHRFVVDDAPAATHVRLDVFPDGGMARLRLHGRLDAGVLDTLRAAWAR